MPSRLRRQNIFESQINTSTTKKPCIDEQLSWQHILTKFIYETSEQGPFVCSNSLIRQGPPTESYCTSIRAFLSSWPCEEQLSSMYHHLIRLASSCSQSHSCTKEKFDLCYLHEYLVLALQGIAAGVPGEDDGWADLQMPTDEQ